MTRRLLSSAWLRRKGRTARWVMQFWPARTLPTAYGPRLVKRAEDLTFRLAILGSYGDFVAQIIAGRDRPFHFIDIGANQGIFSLVASRNPACHSVLAFEPDYRSFAYLVRNIAANDARGITPVCAAISRPEDAVVGMSGDPAHSGGATMMGEAGTSSGLGRVMAMVVPRPALDRLWPAKSDTFQLAKIDVEGAEEIVLRALADAGLLARLDGVIVELNEGVATTPGHGQRVVSLLNEAGFTERARSNSTGHCDAYFVRPAAR